MPLEYYAAFRAESWNQGQSCGAASGCWGAIQMCRRVNVCLTAYAHTHTRGKALPPVEGDAGQRAHLQPYCLPRCTLMDEDIYVVEIMMIKLDSDVTRQSISAPYRKRQTIGRKKSLEKYQCQNP